MKRLRSLTSRARSSEPSSINSEASSLLSSLPQHFATAYVYIDNTPSGSTRSPRFEESEGLRRSSRCRKERLSQLERISEDENQSDRKTRSADRSGLSTSSSRRAGPSSPRKRIKRTRDDPNSEAGSIYAHLKGLRICLPLTTTSCSAASIRASSRPTLDITLRTARTTSTRPCICPESHSRG
ncbi:uncharacterized protein PSANT_06935 [Moesziomyces antarcticus]|uniref:Uncharacterized protein n=1 Tax=Pseudozyma antarctica TaxID=84753 RepID=A0A5C3FY23_PSEA2|nr:uncharacterized protein PSANT_06935 [Moesziomyces antarcticus]